MASDDDIEALRAERDALRVDLRHARLWANYYDATITAMERHVEQGQPYVVPDGPGMTEIASDGWGAGDALP